MGGVLYLALSGAQGLYLEDAGGAAGGGEGGQDFSDEGSGLWEVGG